MADYNILIIVPSIGIYVLFILGTIFIGIEVFIRRVFIRLFLHFTYSQLFALAFFPLFLGFNLFLSIDPSLFEVKLLLGLRPSRELCMLESLLQVVQSEILRFLEQCLVLEALQKHGTRIRRFILIVVVGRGMHATLDGDASC